MRQFAWLLEFKLRNFQIGSRYFLILPKLNEKQLDVIRRRLLKNSFEVVLTTSRLKAEKKGASLQVDKAGFCWASADPFDAIAPAIPEILAVPKKKVKLKVLKDAYFRTLNLETPTEVIVLARLESSPMWRHLRAHGLCALSPDEKEVTQFLLGHALGGAMFLTDFPNQTSRSHMIGGRQFYDTAIDASELEHTLKTIGDAKFRNSYLPERGILRFEAFTSPTSEELRRLFDGLGEWCYLRPS